MQKHNVLLASDRKGVDKTTISRISRSSARRVNMLITFYSCFFLQNATNLNNFALLSDRDTMQSMQKLLIIERQTDVTGDGGFVAAAPMTTRNLRTVGYVILI